ncbi:MAG: flagellar export chaperone FliS [Treponema sp.]|jgi:flagellar protein FliS|nr:flagellar export chaperone FliS [Treponema sp.]
METAQGFTAYRETGIKTASPGKLIVLLYNEAIKQLTSASGKIESNGKIKASAIETFNRNIIRAQDIITELMVCLDMEKGGIVSKNLLALYVYFSQELLNANITQNKTKLDFIRDMLSELRNAWAAAAANTASLQSAATRPAVDING